MIKKVVQYNDYDDNVRTDTLYFHLNKFEWLQLNGFA